jgi:hypothetical protein
MLAKGREFERQAKEQKIINSQALLVKNAFSGVVY